MIAGTLQSLQSRTLGSALTADVAIGATELPVEFVADFDEEGGTLLLNDEELAYTLADPDTDIITLAAPMTAAALIDDPVHVLKDGQVSVEWTAHVVRDGEGEDEDTDVMVAEVPHALIPLLPEGFQDLTSEIGVALERKGVMPQVADVITKTPEIVDTVITGSLIRTGLPGSNRVEISDNGSSKGEVRFYTGHANESQSGLIECTAQPLLAEAQIQIMTPRISGAPAAAIILNSDDADFGGDSSRIDLIASEVFINDVPLNAGVFSYQSMNAATIPHATFTQITNWTNIDSPGVGINGGCTVEFEGRYLLNAQIAYAANATGRRIVRIMVNGSAVVQNAVATLTTAGAAAFVTCQREMLLDLGDEVTVEAYQDSGGSLALSTGADRSFFTMRRIGD